MKRFWMALSLITLLLCSACGQVLPATAVATPADHLLFRDDFSNPASGWAPGASSSGVAGYADGVYRLAVDQANSDAWVTPGLSLNDTHAEVDALRIGGDRNNRFGLLCRVNWPAGFYLFLISSDGYYGIGKFSGGQYRLLGSESMLPSDKIPRGTEYLRIRADCVQDRLTLYVNGEKIAEARDSEFQSGDLGLIAGAYDPSGANILFDNFSVMKP